MASSQRKAVGAGIVAGLGLAAVIAAGYNLPTVCPPESTIRFVQGKWVCSPARDVIPECASNEVLAPGDGGYRCELRDKPPLTGAGACLTADDAGFGSFTPVPGTPLERTYAADTTENPYGPLPAQTAVNCVSWTETVSSAVAGDICLVGLPEYPDGGDVSCVWLCTCRIGKAATADITCCAMSQADACNEPTGTYPIRTFH